MIALLGGPLVLLGVHGLALVGAELGNLLVDLSNVRRQVAAPQTHSAPRLVDQVDRLVGQEPVRDVAVGEVGGVHQRLLRVVDLVMLLVGVAEALEDENGVGDGRLFHLDRLEAALERRVLLQVLAVLLEGGGADGLQLAAGQHRLEDAGGVDRSLGRPGPDQGVDLVDEEDDVAACPDLFEDLLQPLLEVTAVARAGDEGTEIEGVEVLVGERVGNGPFNDLLGEALDDGRLADAGLADEHGVVLGAAGQHLHDPLDLCGPPDNGVELAFPSQLGEVSAELVEHGRPAGRTAAARLTAGAAARMTGGL